MVVTAYLAAMTLVRRKRPHQQWRRPAHLQRQIHPRLHIGSGFGIWAFDNGGVISDDNGVIVSDGGYWQQPHRLIAHEGFQIVAIEHIKEGLER